MKYFIVLLLGVSLISGCSEPVKVQTSVPGQSIKADLAQAAQYIELTKEEAPPELNPELRGYLSESLRLVNKTSLAVKNISDEYLVLVKAYEEQQKDLKKQRERLESIQKSFLNSVMWGCVGIFFGSIVAAAFLRKAEMLYVALASAVTLGFAMFMQQYLWLVYTGIGLIAVVMAGIAIYEWRVLLDRLSKERYNKEVQAKANREIVKFIEEKVKPVVPDYKTVFAEALTAYSEDTKRIVKQNKEISK